MSGEWKIRMPVRGRVFFSGAESGLLTFFLLTTHHSPTYRNAGTRRFNSSNQFSTTLIWVGAASSPPSWVMRKRWPSGFYQSREGNRATTQAATLRNLRFMGDGLQLPVWVDAPLQSRL